MNKKKLPRAILMTGDNASAFGALITPGGPIMTPLDEPRDNPGKAVASAAAEGPVEPAPHERSQTPVPEGAAAGPSAVAMPQAQATSAKALVRVGTDKVRRRWQARAIVERHANYSAVGGVIPLPIINIAGVTVIILRMVKSLSTLYGVPFERNRARAIITGVIGGLTPAAASTMTASTLLFIVPGSNLLGLAVSSVTASACTRRIGSIFIDHFESGATLLDFPLPAKR